VGSYLLNEVLLGAFNCTQPKADIYHNTLYRFMPSIRARRYVATHHDCTIERFPHLFREASLVIAAKKKMLRKADLVFCVTEASRKDLLQFYEIERARTVVLTNGSEPLPRSAEAARDLHARVRRPFVLYVGTRAAYKNFSGLLRAFADAGMAKGYDLLAIGGGKLSSGEEKEVKRMGLESSLVALPFASAAMLGEAYAAASLFVYPSIYEGLGLPPLEAMEKGCPVLASATPASLEVCKDAALFFDPFCEKDFTNKLQLGLVDSAERKARVERGYEVCKLYGWDEVVEKMARAYKSIL
jgi:glycosyltransferase involved in cell wall biosynthesis